MYYLILCAFFYFFWMAVRQSTDWEAAAFGFILIPLLTELTCYYYSFVVAGAMLASRRPRIGIGMMVTTLAWLVAEFYWDWFDVKYTYESVVAVLLCAYVTWEMLKTEN